MIYDNVRLDRHYRILIICGLLLYVYLTYDYYILVIGNSVIIYFPSISPAVVRIDYLGA